MQYLVFGISIHLVKTLKVYNLQLNTNILIIDIPFQCDQCDKMFSYKHNLSQHYETHTAEKTYQCNQCDKVFSRNSSLKRHYQVHTSEMCSQ